MVKNLDHIEIDILSEKSLKDGVHQILEFVKPNWSNDKLKFKIYTEGLTNKLIGVWTEDFNEQMLVRIFGEKTDLFIDRDSERKSIEILRAHKCGPELFATFKNGLCYSFFSGIPLSTDSVRKEKIWTAVGKQMVAFHEIKVDTKESCLFPKISNYIDLLPDTYEKENVERLNPIGISKAFLKKEVSELESILSALNCPVVFSHNDILLNNIIWNEDTQVAHFIDYEYAAPNFQAFDIGNHFCEFVGLDVTMDYKKLYPDAEFQRTWIRNYLSCYSKKEPEAISGEEVDKWRSWANKFALASHLFWGSWALLQACHSNIDFDFLEYALLRLEQYRKKKDEFLAL